MTIRKILLPLSGQYDPADPESLELPALETAFLVGRRFDAHVEVFCIEAERTEARTHLALWIAWNGSAEASRAVAMSMDFLRAASDVVVISINEAGPFQPNADDLVDFVRWHGISARSITLDGTAESAGHLLLEQIAEAGVDMLVMGAYARDRIRRLIFGSVTGTVLSHATVPVLMVD